MSEKIYLLLNEDNRVCHASTDKTKLERIFEAVKKRGSINNSILDDWTIKECDDECDDTYVDNMPEVPLWYLSYCTGDYSTPVMVHSMAYVMEKHVVERGWVPVHEIPDVPYINIYVRAENEEAAVKAAKTELRKYLKKQLENYHKSKEDEED